MDILFTRQGISRFSTASLKDYVTELALSLNIALISYLCVRGIDEIKSKYINVRDFVSKAIGQENFT